MCGAFLPGMHDCAPDSALRAPGAGRAAPLLQFAKLVGPQEALQLGLVDRVVPAPQLLPAAEAAMKQVCSDGAHVAA